MRLLALLLLLAAAAPAGAFDQPPRPAGRGQVLRSETVEGVFAGWERGDYLWAQIDVPGRGRIAAQIVQGAVGPFLEAHRGQTLRLTIATERIVLPEAGETEIQRIYDALTRATGPAEFWWLYRLTREQREAARRRFEEALP